MLFKWRYQYGGERPDLQQYIPLSVGRAAKSCIPSPLARKRLPSEGRATMNTSLLLLFKDNICEFIDSKLLQLIIRLLSQEVPPAFSAHAEAALIRSLSATAEMFVLAAI